MLKTYKLNAGNILLVNHSSQLSYKASNSESITVILAQKQSGKKVAIISFQLHGVEVPNYRSWSWKEVQKEVSCWILDLNKKWPHQVYVTFRNSC